MLKHLALCLRQNPSISDKVAHALCAEQECLAAITRTSVPGAKFA